MQIKIIERTPNIESVIASSGRLCYSKIGVSELLEKHSQEDNERFVKMLADMGHESPLEHVSFTFAVEGVSRALSHQLVRHRIASYSQQSQRYVSLDENFDFIHPPSILESGMSSFYGEAINKIHEAYKILTEQLEEFHYDELHTRRFFLREQQGIEMSEGDYKELKREANKKAIEDARYILPNACETKLVFTMNVRTLLHFFEKRCCSRAQWEIRNMANEMLRQCKEISPILFDNAGATCKRGYCKEGRMSCSPKYRGE